MTERFTDYLHRCAAPIWEAQHQHPFVLGIGDGTLDAEKFKHWVKQDYLYLIDYARLFALAVTKAPDLETMTKFAKLVHSVLNVEMNLHRSYARQWGISAEELEKTEKAPTCQAYTDFLLRTAAVGSFTELVAALLPCMWGFCEIGLMLARQGMPSEPRYEEWIRMYSSPEFVDLTDWTRDLMDRCAAGLPKEELQRIEEAFLTSSRYEYAFWEMAYRQEQWAV
ncbi:MAG: thiaminase II [Candidatus Tectomicrobia bacterium]|nr:thiaminase II [Candidatus Tectomicrobia bacterium]